MTLEENKDATAGVIEMTDAKLIDSLNSEPTFRYSLHSEAHWAVNLPENKHDYSLSVSWAKDEVKTKEIVIFYFMSIANFILH